MLFFVFLFRCRFQNIHMKIVLTSLECNNHSLVLRFWKQNTNVMRLEWIIYKNALSSYGFVFWAKLQFQKVLQVAWVCMVLLVVFSPHVSGMSVKLTRMWTEKKCSPEGNHFYTILLGVFFYVTIHKTINNSNNKKSGLEHLRLVCFFSLFFKEALIFMSIRCQMVFVDFGNLPYAAENYYHIIVEQTSEYIGKKCETHTQRYIQKLWLKILNECKQSIC